MNSSKKNEDELLFSAELSRGTMEQLKDIWAGIVESIEDAVDIREFPEKYREKFAEIIRGNLDTLKKIVLRAVEELGDILIEREKNKETKRNMGDEKNE